MLIGFLISWVFLQDKGPPKSTPVTLKACTFLSRLSGKGAASFWNDDDDSFRNVKHANQLFLAALDDQESFLEFWKCCPDTRMHQPPVFIWND